MAPHQSMHPIDLLQLSTELPVDEIVLLGFDPNDCTSENLASVRELLRVRKQRAGGATRFVQPEACQQLKRKFASVGRDDVLVAASTLSRGGSGAKEIGAPATQRSAATERLSPAAFEEPVPASASPQLFLQNDVELDAPTTTAVDASVETDEFASESDSNTNVNSDLSSNTTVSDNDADFVTSSVVLPASRAPANVTTTKTHKARSRSSPGHGLNNADATRLTNGMPDKGKLICPLCPGSYSRKHVVKRHLMDFKHECSRCGLVLTTKRSYERHRALDNCVRAVQDDVPEPSRKRARLT